jgi:F420-dependent methylenetetrahydromethanopterin dehydrogenase
VLTSAHAFARLVTSCLPTVATAHEVLADAAGLAARARQPGT